MSSLLKRSAFMLVLGVTLLGSSGCISDFGYTQADSSAWLKEQVANGTLTQAQADAIAKESKK